MRSKPPSSPPHPPTRPRYSYTRRVVHAFGLAADLFALAPPPSDSRRPSLSLRVRDARGYFTGVFDDVQYLEVLSLRNNRLSFIRPGLFNNMRRLVYLDLTENWISLVSHGGRSALAKHFIRRAVQKGEGRDCFAPGVVQRQFLGGTPLQFELSRITRVTHYILFISLQYYF